MRTSELLGNASGSALWKAKAATVASSLKLALWDTTRGACYDKDATGKTVDCLMHNVRAPTDIHPNRGNPQF